MCWEPTWNTRVLSHIFKLVFWNTGRWSSIKARRRGIILEMVRRVPRKSEIGSWGEAAGVWAGGKGKWCIFVLCLWAVHVSEKILYIYIIYIIYTVFVCKLHITNYQCMRACFVLSNSLRPHGLQPARILCRIFQARTLEWVAIPFSRGIFPTRDWTQVSCFSCTGRWILYHWVTWEAHNKLHIHTNAHILERMENHQVCN